MGWAQLSPAAGEVRAHLHLARGAQLTRDPRCVLTVAIITPHLYYLTSGSKMASLACTWPDPPAASWDIDHIII